MQPESPLTREEYEKLKEYFSPDRPKRFNSFEEAYEGVPPWDLGRPQPTIIEIEKDGKIKGRVIDIGCGTGENALYLAEKGYSVWGIDRVDAAIEEARKKMKERGLSAVFLTGDALELANLGECFETVVDFGLFHTLSDEDRLRMESTLSRVMNSGGLYHMVCFSEYVPGERGPGRVTREEIRAVFQKGWEIQSQDLVRHETSYEPGWAPAWHSVIKKS